MPGTLGIAAGPLGATAVPTAAVAAVCLLALIGVGATAYGAWRLFDD